MRYSGREDAQGVVHPGAVREIPTLQNGGISADGKTWRFHLRPHLVWSDGQPYLDKVVFRIVADEDAVLRDLHARTIDSAYHLNVSRLETYRRLTNYILTATPTSSTFEASKKKEWGTGSNPRSTRGAC